MTNEDAVNVLVNVSQYGYITDKSPCVTVDDDYGDVDNALSIGIMSIMMRIPRKPEYKYIVGENRPLCPICGSLIHFTSMNYCSSCGQAIDWNGNEND